MTFPKGWELVLIVVVIVLLFGARKLPDAARGLGRSLRIFKAEIKDPNDEEGRDAAAGLPPVETPQSITSTPVVPVAPVTPVAPAAPVQAVQPPVVPVQAPEPVPVQPPVQQSPTDR
jgi:sec-independent protein translocase protein TatA